MTLMYKEIMESRTAFEACYAKNKPVIAELVKALNKKKPVCVYFAARGTSDHACTFAKYLLEIYKGIPCVLAAPSVVTEYDGALCLKNALVIGVSQSGAAEDVRTLIARGKACGAITVGITNDPDSVVAKEADWHLDLCAGPEVSVAATKTFITQIGVLTQLVAAWSRSSELSAQLRKVPGLITKTLKTAPAIEKLAPRYRFMTDAFILGRGILYPIAMEMGLKVKETCYVKSQAYAISDFQHGPIAMISNDAPCFVLDLDEHTAADAELMMQRLSDKDADITLLSYAGRTDERAKVVLPMPEGASGVSAAFCAIITMQLLANYLSCAKGLTPDNPRGLKKVTVTK